MATPITWRNVANTVTGNPAAALTAATSAFAVAGENSRAQVKASQEREKLDREALLRSAEGAIWADGKATLDELEQFKGQEGLDVGTLATNIQAANKTTSDIAKAEAIAGLYGSQQEALDYAAAPEQRLDAKTHRDRMAALEEAQLAGANARTDAMTARLEFDKRTVEASIAKGETQAQAQNMWSDIRTAGVEFAAGLKAEGMAAFDEQNPNAQPEERSSYEQSLNDQQDNWANSYVTERVPDAWQQLIKDSKGKIVLEDIKGTEIGSMLSEGRRLNSEEVARVHAKAADRRDRAGKVWGSANQLYNMTPNSDGTWELADTDTAEANKLLSADALGAAQNVIQNRGLETESFEGKGATQKIKDILKIVGGNRQAFKQIFQSDAVISQTAFGEDIDWKAADQMARGLATTIKGHADKLRKVESSSAFISPEEFRSRLQSGQANSVFLKEQDEAQAAKTGIAPTDIGAIAEAVVSTDPVKQTQGTQDFLVARTAMIDNFNTIPDNTKKQYPVQTRALIAALRETGATVDGKKDTVTDPIEALDALERATTAYKLFTEAADIQQKHKENEKAKEDFIKGISG
jgi:hypothetical protein